MVVLELIGAMSCVFAISVIFLNIRTTLEEQEKKPGLQVFLKVLCIILWVLSFPIAVTAYFLNQPSSNRLFKVQNQLKSSAFDIKRKDDLISALTASNELLRNDLNAERSLNQDDVYNSALRTGFEDGYKKGFKTCLTDNNIPYHHDYLIHYNNCARTESERYIKTRTQSKDLN